MWQYARSSSISDLERTFGVVINDSLINSVILTIKLIKTGVSNKIVYQKKKPESSDSPLAHMEVGKNNIEKLYILDNIKNQV